VLKALLIKPDPSGSATLAHGWPNSRLSELSLGLAAQPSVRQPPSATVISSLRSSRQRARFDVGWGALAIAGACLASASVHRTSNTRGRRLRNTRLQFDPASKSTDKPASRYPGFNVIFLVPTAASCKPTKQQEENRSMPINQRVIIGTKYYLSDGKSALDPKSRTACELHHKSHYSQSVILKCDGRKVVVCLEEIGK
jgi:hypothetical protein